MHSLGISLLAAITTCGAISCRGTISTDPSIYVGRYELKNGDPDRSDLPSSVELRSDMTAVEYFGTQPTQAVRAAGRWYILGRAQDDADIVFADEGHPIRMHRGEIRLYLNFDLDEYFAKSREATSE